MYIDNNYNIFDLIGVKKTPDYTDLYYQHHWACREKRINGNTLTGELLSDNVYDKKTCIRMGYKFTVRLV